MHECTSPPQTPTPRTGNNNQSPSSSLVTEQIKNDSTNSNKMSSTSPVNVNPNLQINAQHSSTNPTTNLFTTNGNLNVSQLDLEFPKLTPPKSKSPRNNISSNSNNGNANNNDHHSNESVNDISIEKSSATSNVSNTNEFNGSTSSTSITASSSCVHVGYSQAHKLKSNPSKVRKFFFILNFVYCS